MKPIAVLVLFLLMVSSASAHLKKFTVEIPHRPTIALSDSIQSLVLLNRSLTPEFENFIDDSLQVSFYRSNFHIDRVLLDSLVADTSLIALGDRLFESDRFDVVIPLERNIVRYLPYTQTPDTLSWNYVRSMCELYDAHALLVLENLAMRVVTGYKRQRQYVYDNYYMVHNASIDVYYRAQWRLYDPKKEEVLVQVTDVDTLFWDAERTDVNVLFFELPSVKQACIETGFYAATKFSEIIAPKWSTETRYYYVMKNSAIDQSIKHAAQGEWNLALENWVKYIDSGSRSSRSKVMLNVALAYEMLGNIDTAISWLNRSQNEYYREITNHYLKQLLIRQSTLRPKKMNASRQ
jgi:tetratricopeptide (TPR) repeat protein